MNNSGGGQTETDELQLCNCDGFWHIECPDGVTRYVSEKSLQEYSHRQTEQVLDNVIRAIDGRVKADGPSISAMHLKRTVARLRSQGA
jgi:hypothetical protein